MSYDPKTSIGQVLDSAADVGKLLQVASDGSITAVTGGGGATGAAGSPGSVWYQGSGVPSSGTGVNGDWYLRLNPGGSGDGDVYQKAAGAWAVVGNIKGPAGIQGVVGAAGAQGIQGVQGVQGVAGAAGANGQGYLWRGTWDSATVYAAYDCVFYNGSGYVAVAGSTNVTPGTDATKWNLFAQQGATGAGGSGGSGIRALNIRLVQTSTYTVASNDDVLIVDASGLTATGGVGP